MKNKISLLLILILFLTGCTSNLERINYEEFQKKLKNKDTFILEISQEGCSHCDEFAPIIKSVLKDNNIKAYNLNITYVNQQDYSKLEEKYNFEGTPTTMFFKNGKELISSRIEGSISKKKLKNILKRLGYIKN